MFITTVEAEWTAYPDTRLFLSDHRSFVKWLMQAISTFTRVRGKGFIPPPFYRSFSQPIDPRLPKLAQGLGVIVGRQARFYPVHAVEKGGFIDDFWDGRALRVERGLLDGIPSAAWADSGKTPMQLLTRWYGFAFTYPHCEIYGHRMTGERPPKEYS